jgi:hypothetical protein
VAAAAAAADVGAVVVVDAEAEAIGSEATGRRLAGRAVYGLWFVVCGLWLGPFLVYARPYRTVPAQMNSFRRAFGRGLWFVVCGL